MRGEMMAELLTVQETIKRLSISRATLYRYIEEGLEYVTVGANKKMFDPVVVAEFKAKRKDSVINLVEGTDYTNPEICDYFRVSYMGSIRKSNTKNALVVISYPYSTRFDYHDYWDGDVLYFYGQGAEGDQDLSIGYNKALADSKRLGLTVYLFESFESGKYKYRGIVELIDDVSMENVTDNNEARNVFKFPLRLVNRNEYLSDDYISKEESHISDEIEKMSDKDVAALVEKINVPITQRKVVTTRISRNLYAARYARMRANGYCELCSRKAPFEVNGEPFLEIDHIIPFSHGGTDSIDNLAALCPNCNRMKAHKFDDEMMMVIKRNIEINEEKLQRHLHGAE